MRLLLQAAIGAAFFTVSGFASAQDLIPDRRFVVTQDQDLPGGDLS